MLLAGQGLALKCKRDYLVRVKNQLICMVLSSHKSDTGDSVLKRQRDVHSIIHYHSIVNEVIEHTFRNNAV